MAEMSEDFPLATWPTRATRLTKDDQHKDAKQAKRYPPAGTEKFISARFRDFEFLSQLNDIIRHIHQLILQQLTGNPR
jgi:hypothetical protein